MTARPPAGPTFTALGAAFALALAATTAMAQDFKPTVDWEDLMDSLFYDKSGLLVLDRYDLAFAPEGKAKVQVGVVNAEGEVVSVAPALEDYAVREGVFAKLRVKGPAQVQLTEPGLYTLVFLFDGEPITRFPFTLKQVGDGSDPFAPEKTYAFDGYWRSLAHITVGGSPDRPIPELSLWLGGQDLQSAEQRNTLFMASLYRDGTLVAHTKRRLHQFTQGHFKRQAVTFSQPHEPDQEVNAPDFTMADLADGDYEIKVTRIPDRTQLRHFVFTVADGKIQQHPRATLGFEPQVDFILPRVTKKGSTVYEFVEAFWIGSKKR